ncbi:MAG: DUF364 domain-containing protein [Campylobacter sp.]|nr:DUF364 domain-containing protein [Campylobacter sp.]
MSEILNETLDLAKEILGEEALNLRVEHAVIGLFFTGVKLENGACGVSYTPLKSIGQAVCCPTSAGMMPNSGEIAGKSVRYLLKDLESPAALKKTLAIAALNALGKACIDKARPQIKFNADPFERLEIKQDSFSVIIGALVPYIKFMMKKELDFRILELDKSTLKQNELKFYLPASEAKNVVPRADNVIITATTLINDTLEELLSFKKQEAKAIVVGPTALTLPNALFARGADYVGGVYVRRADELLDVLAQAGSGYHFFGKFADKITMEKG